ncbi:MAG: hypothetical protein KKD28_13480 [Chloroflexi bacterium]|nr:hypothetical protein [Chloroflexota bacterium]
MSDTIAIQLAGDTSLDSFADVIQSFKDLVSALTLEVVGDGESIQWQISRLEAGSAFAEVRGYAAIPEDVSRVVQAYQVVGNALADKTPIPYSENVIKPAHSITAVIGEQVTAVTFVTDDYRSVIDQPWVVAPDDAPAQNTVGTVTGFVRAIWDTTNIRIGLYDQLFDRIVYCYLDSSFREIVRTAWGKRVRVVGTIRREPGTGRPIDVRSVKQIISLPQRMDTNSFRKLRGAFPWQAGDPPAEYTIRRVRNGI